ncbi:NrfD/PsrC family molybdoenzyme membrane anchor subunit [Ornithinimicrobium avium]|uniref:Nitrite reductase n=1 Tax=Ornithinimicrobium avium TaxID=2283195 RepID=A0A345NND9_9MICO|nr:NrfD/PsrC family molybdoenzyme membrane anchor subunit [Ornithinimicrobium avium]AXH96547.1 nitrite reductase [Ornithinimicrobium avium]
MTTSSFDSYRPPEDGPRRRRRSSVRGAVTGAGRDVARAGRSWLNRDGGGRREAPAVPDAEFSDYYGQAVIKPVPWKHEIPAYLFVGGIAGASGLIAAGASATGRHTLRRNSRYTAIATVALSGAALVADLGRPERFLNMLRTVKLTSPMSVGTWILSGYAAFAGVATASEVARSLTLPRGGVLALVQDGLALVDAPAAVGQALFGPPLAAYTAVLLSDTVTPVWFESRAQLPYVFVASAAMAASGVQLVLSPAAESGPVRRLAVAGAATDLLAMHLLEEHLEGLELGEPLETGPAGTKLRLARALTVAGGIGALVSGRSRLLAAASGIALAAASALTRFGIVEAGMESAKDPRYTVGPQKRRLEQRRREGTVHDSIVTVG